jgi:HNH endonuclease
MPNNFGVCIIDTCTNSVYARDWCRKHYARFQKYDDPLGTAPSRSHAPECSVEDCVAAHYGKSYCAKHYHRFKKYGDPLGGGPEREHREGCSIEGCQRPYFSSGFCRRHYHAREAPPGNGLAPNEKAPRPCSVEGCVTAHYAHGYCPKHYQRWKQYGDAEAPFRRALDGEGWRGVNNQGYVVLKKQGTTILEHRQVMETVLGRELYPNENVHHKNGVKTDNDPGNLEVWVVSQPTGQRVEDVVAHAEEMLRRYAPEKLAAV